MYRNEWSIHRKTIGYFPSRESSSTDPGVSSNSYMFGEDIQHRIMPYRIDDSSVYTIQVSPDSQDNRKALSIIFSDDLNPRIADAVAEAIRKYAYRLVWWGRVNYEVASVEIGASKQRKGKNQATSLPKSKLHKPVYIPGKVLIIGNTLVQLIPRADLTHFGHLFITIPKSKLWSLSVPRRLGGLRELKNLQRALTMSSDMIPKSFKDTDWPREKRFNWSEFTQQRKMLAAKGTARWGWPGRNLWDKDLLEYYLLYRELRFAWSLSVLREYILGEMNKFLMDHEYPFQIEITGFPSHKEMEEAIERFKEGKLSFNQVLDLSRLREK